MRAVWLIVTLALSLGLLFTLGRNFREESRREEAREDVKRLTKVTLRLFQNRRPPTGEHFWKEIGRAEPLRDPWGTPYRLEASSKTSFLWRSAAEDLRYQTGDDVLVEVPFGDGITLDMTQPQMDPTPWVLPSRDAR